MLKPHEGEDEPPSLHELYRERGRVGVETMLTEIAKLRCLRRLGPPVDLLEKALRNCYLFVISGFMFVIEL